jgi:threonine synthase
VTEVAVPLIERYRDRLPVSNKTPIVSLGEGSTPLLHAPRLSERLGLDLWLKWEASNPTASYKDRGMTVAVSKALEDGARAVVCASTGNTSASAAAYAARAGLQAIVLVAESAARGKLIQARALGARVLAVRGSFDQALTAARRLGERGDHVLVNSLNPNRVEGQKTAVFEIFEDLGHAPDAFVLPYGGGGNTTAYAKALSELGLSTPIYSIEAADRTRTLASAIQIREPAHRERVEASGANVHAVTDEEIVAAWLELARQEGLFCEPSSAAGLAFLRGRHELRGSRVVVTVTGHGLKDPGAADCHAPAPLVVDPDPDAVARATA